MSTWARLGMGVAALAMAVAIGTGAYAMRGNDDDRPSVTAEDSIDGATGDEAAGDQGLGLSAMCVEGAEDCVDTIGMPYNDFGELPAKCAADAVDCVEPGCPEEGCTAYNPIYECVAIESDPPVDPPAQECKLIGCEVAEGAEGAQPVDMIAPVPGELVDPAPAEDIAARENAAAEQAADCGAPLPVCEDPAISACVPPDCAVSSDGSVSCPVSEPVDCLPTEPGPDDEIATLPCVVEPCVPGPAVDCGVVDNPCVPGPATDCGVIDCEIGIDPAVDVPAGAPPPCVDSDGTDPGAGGGSDGSPGVSEGSPGSTQ